MLNRYSNPFPFSGNDTMCEKYSFSPPTQSAVTSSNIIVWSIWISHVEDMESSYKYSKFFAKTTFPLEDFESLIRTNRSETI